MATAAVRARLLPGLAGAAAREVAAAQQDALITLVKTIPPASWNRPTDCSEWSVKDIVCHLVAVAELFTSPRELVRQQARATRRRRDFPSKLDALNHTAVEARRHLTPAELVKRLEETSHPYLRLRARVGRWGRVVPIYMPHMGWANWAFFMDVIITRDVFMHRIDIARGAGAALDLGDHDRRVVADLVRHWERSSGARCRLELTGPAGGTFECGRSRDAEISGDAVDFARMLSGRAGTEVMTIAGDTAAARRWLATPIPF